MDEFDKIIKNELKENIQISKKVDLKIKNAYSEIRNKKVNKITMKNTVIKIIAEIVILLFAGTNLVAYATEKTNIISWVLDKLNLGEAYEEHLETVDYLIKDKETTITLKNVAIDSGIAIFEYNVKFDKEIKYPEYFTTKDIGIEFNGNQGTDTGWEYDERIICNDYEYKCMADGYRQSFCNKISENEYEVYHLYHIEPYIFKGTIEIDSNIYSINFDVGDVPTEEEIICNGNWKFHYEIDSQKCNNSVKYYNVNNAKVQIDEEDDLNYIKLNNIIQTDIGTILVFEKGYTEGVIEATFELLDENENIILNKDIEELTGIGNFVKKMEENKEYTIKLYVKKYVYEIDKVEEGSYIYYPTKFLKLKLINNSVEVLSIYE